MTMGPLPPIEWHVLLSQWDVRLGWTVVAVLLLVPYLLAARTAGLGAGRITAYCLGVVLLWLSVCSAVDVYSGTVFWMHMIQHLLLITVVPALLVVGHPLTVLDHVTNGGAARALRRGPLALVTAPVVGFLLYAVVIVATHLTGFMDQMMTSAWRPAFEQALYLVAGYLYLLPLLGREPIRWRAPILMRVMLLVIGMIPDTVVGIVLLQTNTNPFPGMLVSGRDWAPDPVHDVNIGGALMWVLGDGLMMVLAVAVVVVMLSSSDRGNVVGPWLEGVRRSQLRTHADFAADADVDDDEDVLDAYNAMLARMNGAQAGSQAGSAGSDSVKQAPPPGAGE